MIARDNESGDVGDVGHQKRTHRVGNLAGLLPVDEARVRGGTHDDQFGFVLERERHHLIKVHVAIFRRCVLDGLVVAAREIDWEAVGHMAAVKQVHPHERVARIQQSKHRRDIGGASRCWLTLAWVTPKKLFGSIAREVLDDVDPLVPAVVAESWVAFEYLLVPMEPRASRTSSETKFSLGDHLQSCLLPLEFAVECLGQLWIKGRNRHRCRK